jgi:hypothetical protein
MGKVIFFKIIFIVFILPFFILILLILFNEFSPLALNKLSKAIEFHPVKEPNSLGVKGIDVC